MIDFPEIQDLVKPNNSKIIMLVVDGLGGLYHPDYGKTELEYANIPEIDNLAKQSDCGLTLPVLPGITPGSGPGHLSLFGYDPIKYTIGRGILEAIGISLFLPLIQEENSQDPISRTLNYILNLIAVQSMFHLMMYNSEF